MSPTSFLSSAAALDRTQDGGTIVSLVYLSMVVDDICQGLYYYNNDHIMTEHTGNLT